MPSLPDRYKDFTLARLGAIKEHLEAQHDALKARLNDLHDTFTVMRRQACSSEPSHFVQAH